MHKILKVIEYGNEHYSQFNIDEETIKKLNEIKDSEALKKGFEEIKQSSTQVKENIDEFMNSEEVKQTIEKAKTGTIDVAEKALDTLKSWLSPEGEDK